MSHHRYVLHTSEHLGTVCFCSHAGGERRCLREDGPLGDQDMRVTLTGGRRV